MPVETPNNVLDRVRDWPAERRVEAERMLEAKKQAGAAVYRLSAEARAFVQDGLEKAKRGEFVPDAEMQAFWKRHQE